MSLFGRSGRRPTALYEHIQLSYIQCERKYTACYLHTAIIHSQKNICSAHTSYGMPLPRAAMHEQSDVLHFPLLLFATEDVESGSSLPLHESMRKQSPVPLPDPSRRNHQGYLRRNGSNFRSVRNFSNLMMGRRHPAPPVLKILSRRDPERILEGKKAKFLLTRSNQSWE